MLASLQVRAPLKNIAIVTLLSSERDPHAGDFGRKIPTKSSAHGLGNGEKGNTKKENRELVTGRGSRFPTGRWPLWPWNHDGLRGAHSAHTGWSYGHPETARRLYNDRPKQHQLLFLRRGWAHG